jgi:hypothetical protein
VAPPRRTSTYGYTQPVEYATMREAANASATRAGTCAFIAQVRSSWPDDPNLRPAMKMTLGSFGNALT